MFSCSRIRPLAGSSWSSVSSRDPSHGPLRWGGLWPTWCHRGPAACGAHTVAAQPGPPACLAQGHTRQPMSQPVSIPAPLFPDVPHPISGQCHRWLFLYCCHRLLLGPTLHSQRHCRDLGNPRCAVRFPKPSVLLCPFGGKSRRPEGSTGSGHSLLTPLCLSPTATGPSCGTPGTCIPQGLCTATPTPGHSPQTSSELIPTSSACQVPPSLCAFLDPPGFLPPHHQTGRQGTAGLTSHMWLLSPCARLWSHGDRAVFVSYVPCPWSRAWLGDCAQSVGGGTSPGPPELPCNLQWGPCLTEVETWPGDRAALVAGAPLGHVVGVTSTLMATLVPRQP